MNDKLIYCPELLMYVHKKSADKTFLFAVEVFDYLWHKYQSEAHAGA